MAVGGPTTGGSLTGNPQIDTYTSRATAGGTQATPPGTTGFGQAASPYDPWRSYFSTPDPSPWELGIPMIPDTSRFVRPPSRGPQPPFSVREGDSLFGAGGLGSSSTLNIPESARRVRPPSEEEREARKAVRSRDADRQRLEDLARRAGLVGESFIPSELDAIWQAAVDEAESSSHVTGEQVEPWEILEHWASDPALARQYGVAQPSAPPIEELVPEEDRTITRTNTSTALTSPEAAQAVIMQGLKSVLHRDPRPNEIAAFREYLNQQERENPTITESTSVITSTGETETTESVTEGGALSPTDAASNFLERDEFEDEEFAVQMGIEGADVMRALVGSLA